MKEKIRISSLFGNLYDGNPWIDVTIKETLSKITAKVAANHAFTECNSIWEIVNHMISWRINVLKRVQGKNIKTPDNNYFEKIIDTSELAWEKTLKRLEDSQAQWLSFLEIIDPATFSKIYPNNQMNYYEHIHGILQHDAYHLGQIVLIAKFSF